MDKNLTVLGSTGSIGVQALDVVRSGGFKINCLAANQNEKALEAQCREFSPKLVCIGKERYSSLKTLLADTETKVVCGEEGLCECASDMRADAVLNAVTGIAGLNPTLAAIEAKKTIALANKETLVAGGEIVMKKALENSVDILPVDSEHSAIFQCLQNKNKIKKILLTGSGGSFFGKTRADLKDITPEQAVLHPKWNMGKKISVDSSTLMNKGLELIEAVRLFCVKPEQVEVYIHRESIVHSMVEFEDNAVIAMLAVPDMRLCIQYALNYPNRKGAVVPELDLFAVKNLSFYKPDTQTFPLLEQARSAVLRGGNIPAVLNGANEAAVALFLNHKIGFNDISDFVIQAVDSAEYIKQPTISDIFASDSFAREAVLRKAESSCHYS